LPVVVGQLLVNPLLEDRRVAHHEQHFHFLVSF
jgi:hypothetical protein